MRLLMLLVVYALLSVVRPVGAATSHEQALTQRLERATHDISLLKDSQVELRRDQLNYKIEKDILKESYSSSLQTLNMALTFILGLLAILGYLGIRDIASMKKEYSEHLEKLGVLRQQFESELAQVGAEQATVREELTNVLQVNKQQDNRIKVLELQEQAANLITRRSYDRALEYIAIGLDIAPNDYILLSQKALCFMKLENFSDAIVVLQSLLNQDPNNPSAIQNLANLAEAFLLMKNFVEFDKLKSSYMTQLSSIYEGAALAFFDSLRAFLSSDVDAMKTTLKSLARSDLSIPQKQWMPGWDFGDVNKIVAKSADGDVKRYFMLGISFLSGTISTQQLLTELG